MAVFTAAGCQLLIATTSTGSTYQLIGEVTNMGAFGRVYDEIKYSALDNRNVLKFKGQRDDGSMTVALGRASADAGQAILITALDSDDDWNFEIKLNDKGTFTNPTVIKFKAKVMSYTTDIGGPNQVVGAATSLGIASGSITEVAAH